MPTYETRKLVRWGSSNTLIVSIPRKWIRRYDLTEDDEVKITETHDGRLIISPVKHTYDRKEYVTEIDLRKYPNPDELLRIIQSRYVQGYDKIIVKATDKIQKNITNLISSLTSELFGFEIAETTLNTIILKDVLTIKESDVGLLIKIISQKAIDAFKTFLDILKSLNLSLIDNVMNKHQTIYLYSMRIRRQLRKALQNPSLLSEMGLEYTAVADYAFFVRDVENIADAILSMTRTLERDISAVPSQKDIIEFLEKVMNLFIEAARAFLFQKIRAATKLYKNIDNLVIKKRNIENYLDKESALKSTVAYQIILDNSEKIIEYCKNIILTTLRKA